MKHYSKELEASKKNEGVDGTRVKNHDKRKKNKS